MPHGPNSHRAAWRALLTLLAVPSLGTSFAQSVSEAQILRGISSAEHEITVYAQALRNKAIASALLEAQSAGVKIRLIVPASELHSSTSFSLSLSVKGVTTYRLTRNYPATSFALIDRRVLILGEQVGRRPTLEDAYPTRMLRDSTQVREVNSWLDRVYFAVSPLNLRKEIGRYFRLPKRSS